MRVVAVHGINSNGERNVDVLANAVHAQTGCEVLDFNYPRISVFRALWALSVFRYEQEVAKYAKELAAQTVDGDHVIAHSFGAAVALCCALEHGRKFGHVWLIAPAVDRDDYRTLYWMSDFYHFDTLTVVSNPFDRALKAGLVVPWISMSKLGLRGITPPDERFANYPVPEMWIKGQHNDPLNHSYAFHGDNLTQLSEYISRQLRSV